MRLKMLSLITIMWMSISAYSQAPDSLKYQAIVRDANGYVMVEKQVGIEISILQGTINGAAVYVEAHSALTNTFGLVNLIIGGGVTTFGAFSTIDWSDGPYYVKVGLDPEGGTSYSTIMGTSQLLSVPYALHAKTAQNVLLKTYAVGDLAQGGIVFYVNSTGTHGLVAANIDQYTNINWFNAQDELNNPGRHDVAGAKYFDWRLPSKWELNLMYTNLHLSNLGGFADDGNMQYWSSTQLLPSSDPNVWRQRFDNGNQVNDGPGDTEHVRAIRAF